MELIDQINRFMVCLIKIQYTKIKQSENVSYLSIAAMQAGSVEDGDDDDTIFTLDLF